MNSLQIPWTGIHSEIHNKMMWNFVDFSENLYIYEILLLLVQSYWTS